MQSSKSVRSGLFFVLGTLVLVVSGCGRPNADSTSSVGKARLSVVATTNLVGDAVAKVGGDLYTSLRRPDC